MANMKPSKVDTFQNESEKQSYELLKNLDDSYMVVYEPSIGLQKKSTPDFILLSEKYGLVVLDVKSVNLSNIKESNPQTITKISGMRIANFHATVKNYAFSVHNQLVKEFKDNSKIVHSSTSKLSGKLTFPHSSGLLLYIHNEAGYTNDEVAKILSLNEKNFLIINKIRNPKEEIEQFIKNLNRPFLEGISVYMKGEILKKIYMDSDASSTEFVNSMSAFNIRLNENFKEKLEGSVFEKSRQLKTNLLEYTIFSQNSVEMANKNLYLGCDNIIDRLKAYKEDLEEEKFTVAVFGYFGTGKSTFLNALMGTDKLPMDEDRSTATFTRLKHCAESEYYKDGDMEVIYKDKLDISIAYKEAINKLNFDDEKRHIYLEFDKLEIFKSNLTQDIKNIKIIDFGIEYRDKIKNAKKILGYIFDNNIPYGTSAKVAKEDIKEFLTDDRKAFGISEVIYYLDNKLLMDIEIVDTPGYGSENTIDTFKTREFIKEANVLILLTEAKDPMSKEDEHEFLETYASIYSDVNNNISTENLFVVANKVDVSNKTVQEIIVSIKQKIEDNWEDSLVLKEKQIFTMSAKFHYDKAHENESVISNENIHIDDLENFITTYSSFLTINKDKDLVKNSFKNIEDTITELHTVFSRIVNEINKDINDVKNKKDKFENNKTEIAQTYDLYSKAISNIETELNKEVRNKLAKQKLSNKESAEEAFKRYLKSLNLKSNDANKEHTKEFYSKLSSRIYGVTSKENNERFIKNLDESMIVINRQIEKFSKELEETYGITGLDKKISLPTMNAIQFSNIEFEKGFINGILDIITFGQFVDAQHYAKQMVKRWDNDTKLKIEQNISSSNNMSILAILNEFKIQNKNIVDSIKDKLDDIEKQLTSKQKDKEEYDKKVNKITTTFTKIDKLRDTIVKQESALYG